MVDKQLLRDLAGTRRSPSDAGAYNRFSEAYLRFRTLFDEYIRRAGRPKNKVPKARPITEVFRRKGK